MKSLFLHLLLCFYFKIRKSLKKKKSLDCNIFTADSDRHTHLLIDKADPKLLDNLE